MAEVGQSIEVRNGGIKRKSGKKKGKMAKKRQRAMPQGSQHKVKVDKKMKKLFERRVRNYNSDDEGDHDPVELLPRTTGANSFKRKDNEFEGGVSRSTGANNRFKRKDDEFEEGGLSDDGEEENQGSDAEEVSEDENGRLQPGITKFTEGIKAFKSAFKKIVKRSGGADEDVLVSLNFLGIHFFLLSFLSEVYL